MALLLSALVGMLVTSVVRQLERALASERLEASERVRADAARREAEQVAMDGRKLQLVGRRHLHVPGRRSC